MSIIYNPLVVIPIIGLVIGMVFGAVDLFREKKRARKLLLKCMKRERDLV